MVRLDLDQQKLICIIMKFMGIRKLNLSYLLQSPLVVVELLQLNAVPDPRQLPPQCGRLPQTDGQTWGGRPAFGSGGLRERQAFDTGDGAPVAQGVRVRDSRERRERSAGGRRRGQGRRGGSLAHGHNIGASLAQDLKVLGGLAVLLVELSGIWEKEEEKRGRNKVEGREGKKIDSVSQERLFAFDIPFTHTGRNAKLHQQLFFPQVR